MGTMWKMPKVCVKSTKWTHVSASVIPGHSYTLTLINYDDNWPTDPSYTMFDNIAFSTLSGNIVEIVNNPDDTRTVWLSGVGSTPQWTARNNCSSYDLCTLSYIFDGSSTDKVGKAIDFAGPSSRSGPWRISTNIYFVAYCW